MFVATGTRFPSRTIDVLFMFFLVFFSVFSVPPW